MSACTNDNKHRSAKLNTVPSLQLNSQLSNKDSKLVLNDKLDEPMMSFQHLQTTDQYTLHQGYSTTNVCSGLYPVWVQDTFGTFDLVH